MVHMCNATIQTVRDHFKGSLNYRGELQASLGYEVRCCSKSEQSESSSSLVFVVDIRYG